jgi:Tol biopolymer transport system component
VDGPGRIEGPVFHAEATGLATVRVRSADPEALSDSTTVRVVPDGYVVFASRGVHVARSRLDGSDMRAIEGGPARGVSALQGGTTVAALYQAGNRLWITDFSSSTRLTVGLAGETLFREGPGRLSPDGSRVYFTGARRNAAGEVWATDMGGTVLERLTAAVAPEVDHGYPAPSPDGTTLVYSDQRPPDLVGDLTLLDLASLSTTPLGARGVGTAWSPDGTWIAYTDSLGALRRVRSDGTDDRLVFAVAPAERGVFHGFDWSPDGRYILAPTREGSLFLVDVATSDTVRLRLAHHQIHSIAFVPR